MGTNASWSCIRARKSLWQIFKDPERAPLTESTDELIAAAKTVVPCFYSGKGGGERQVTLKRLLNYRWILGCEMDGTYFTGQNSSDPMYPILIFLFPSG